MRIGSVYADVEILPDPEAVCSNNDTVNAQQYTSLQSMATVVVEAASTGTLEVGSVSCDMFLS